MKLSFLFCMLLGAFEGCVKQSAGVAPKRINPLQMNGMVAGTADYDSRFRYQFVALNGLIYLRRMTHPGGDEKTSWKSFLSKDDYLFLERTSKNPGKSPPFAPPGPLASFTSLKASFDKRPVTRFHDWESSNSFRDQLMNFLRSVCDRGESIPAWPTEVEVALAKNK